MSENCSKIKYLGKLVTLLLEQTCQQVTSRHVCAPTERQRHEVHRGREMRQITLHVWRMMCYTQYTHRLQTGLMCPMTPKKKPGTKKHIKACS